jgi:hypothetical protein
MTWTAQIVPRESLGQTQVWGLAFGILVAAWFAAATLTVVLLLAAFDAYSGLGDIARALNAMLPDTPWFMYTT